MLRSTDWCHHQNARCAKRSDRANVALGCCRSGRARFSTLTLSAVHSGHKMRRRNAKGLALSTKQPKRGTTRMLVDICVTAWGSGPFEIGLLLALRRGSVSVVSIFKAPPSFLLGQETPGRIGEDFMLSHERNGDAGKAMSGRPRARRCRVKSPSFSTPAAACAANAVSTGWLSTTT
jgi:hypothetical protein